MAEETANNRRSVSASKNPSESTSQNKFDYQTINLQDVMNNLPDTSGSGRGTSDASMVSPQIVNDIINNLLDKVGIDKNTTNFNRMYVTISHACQRGATSPRYPDSAMITDYGIDLNVGDLRKSCSDKGTTVRKLARTIRDNIVEVARRFNLEGNLAKRYKLDNPDYDEQHRIWVSDFNTFLENPAIPPEVKQWLLDNFNNRFVKK